MSSQNRYSLGIILSASLMFGLSSCGGEGSEESAVQVDARTEVNFAHLITHFGQGQPRHQPWANTFWSYTDDGIASTSYSSDRLSPAGKYDAARGCNGSQSALRWEHEKHGKKVKEAQGWWGHCNGWSVAASLYGEPPERLRVNGVEFTRADIKALLSEAGMLADYEMWGNPVDPARGMSLSAPPPEYYDLPPGQFFLVMTNYMGKLKMPIILDQDTGPEIWNQPVAGYRFETPRREDYRGTIPGSESVHKMRARVTVWWANDSGVDPRRETPVFNWQDAGNLISSKSYEMELWLDGPPVFEGERLVSSGNVMVFREGETVAGGDWVKGTRGWNEVHPDFLWIAYGLQDAADSELNPPERTYANPYIDHQWLVRHLVNGMPGEWSTAPCPVPTLSPGPSPSPSGSVSPVPRPTVAPLPGASPRPSPNE